MEYNRVAIDGIRPLDCPMGCVFCNGCPFFKGLERNDLDDDLDVLCDYWNYKSK